MSIAKKHKFLLLRIVLNQYYLHSKKDVLAWVRYWLFFCSPTKNLNAIGDAGYFFTNNYKVYKKIKFKNHGDNRDNVKNFGICV